MMKIVSLFGSPRKKGNTAKVLSWVEEELREKGHEVDRVIITDYNVNGCLGCYACQENPEEPACVQKDDAVKIFYRMIEADGIIYASPLYCWGFTSQIKPLIDRHLCLTTGYGTDKWKSLIEGKRSGLIVTCAGPEEGNTDPIKGVYKGLMNFTKCHIAGMLIVPFTTTPEELPEETKQKAIEFANILTE